jgi:uncharacterized protein with von Willebrand factor type A (vWA) domain
MKKSFVLPLESLVQRLQAADFEINAATYYKLQKAIYALGSDYLEQPEQLPRILAPIVVQSEEEQIRFHQVFGQFYQEVLQGAEVIAEDLEEAMMEEEAAEAEEDIEADFKRAARKRRAWVYPVGGILILLLLILVFKGKPNQENAFRETWAELEDEVKTPEKTKSQAAPRPFPAYSKQEAKAEIQLDHTPPEVGKGMLISSRYKAPNYEYLWFLNEKKLRSREAKVWLEFTESGMNEIRLVVLDGSEIELMENIRGDRDAKGTAQHSVFLHVRPAGTVPMLTDRDVEQAKLERKQFFVKLVVFCLYILLVVGTELYMRWYRFSFYQKAFRSKFIPEENAPYQLPHDASTHELEAEEELYALARAMKHPQESHYDQLDMDATLYETIRSGGYPMLQYVPLEKEAEYLILVDESAPSEVQAGLFSELMRMLRREGVHLYIYTFNSDPRTCYVPGSKQEISLEALAQKFGMHRLIMFSKGTYMTAPNQQEVADWVSKAFGEFEQRILLTPEPQAVWGKREAILASFFLLLPFNTSSQQKLTEAMLDPEHAAFDDLREKVFAQVQESLSLEAYDFDKEEDVRAYLGDGVFEWLTASMMYPQPDWQVIMEVGKELELKAVTESEGDLLVRSKSGNTLLTMENLSKLASVPWIQQAEWPEEIRQKLLNNMAPATAQQASLAISHALEAADLPHDSAAWKLREAYRAVNAAHLHPGDPLLQKQLRFLYQQDLLDKKQQTEAADKIEMSWAYDVWHKMGDKVTRYAIILGLIVLPVVMGVYSFNQISQHRNTVLIEKYYERYQMNEMGPMSFLETGCHALENRESDKALSAFSRYLDYHTNVQEIASWYAALAHLQLNDHEAAQKLLGPLARDPQKLYHDEAKALQEELNSVWHRLAAMGNL